MDQINTLQITAAIRQVLIFAGGFAVAKGWIDNDTMMALVPAVLTIGVAAWGLYVRRTSGVIKAAASLPEVQAIVAPAVARKLPENVVSSVAQAARVPGVNP